MIRYFCQTISFLLLSSAFLTGCLAAGPARPPAGDYPPDGALRDLVWGLAGWLEPVPPSGAPSDGLRWRAVPPPPNPSPSPPRPSSFREMLPEVSDRRTMRPDNLAAPADRGPLPRPGRPSGVRRGVSRLTPAPEARGGREARTDGGDRTGGASPGDVGTGGVPSGRGADKGPPSGAGTFPRLAMGFPEELSSWPSALEVGCLDARGAWLTVRDAAPFGGPNITVSITGGADGRGDRGVRDDRDVGEDDGAGARLLSGCLARAREALWSGPLAGPVVWREVEPGLRLAAVAARFGPRLGSREIILLSASPKFFRLAPYHEAENERWAGEPGGLALWLKRLPEAAALINGGQYYPDRKYMGTLRRRGVELGGRAHPGWKGFLVQDPLPAREKAAGGTFLLDLDLAGEDGPRPEDYATVAQSHMVLDRLGRVRVRTSDRLASRSALGVGRDGDMVLVFAPGAATLADLAVLLESLGLVSVMGLDGGAEARLVVNGPGGPEFFAGRRASNFLGNFLLSGPGPSLPSVLALERIGRAADGSPSPGAADGGAPDDHAPDGPATGAAASDGGREDAGAGGMR